jgi:hypothetical protein
VRALREDLVRQAWSIDVVYAEDDDADSDAIAIRHASGGVFAQFYTGEGDHPRAAVLGEFLRSYVFRPYVPPEPR